jgi:hypothetical protein
MRERAVRKPNLLPPILPKWGGMPPNWNSYFPWYLVMPLMTIAAGNSNGDNKFLNYPEYTNNSNPNTHVCVFKQVIKVNGVT